MRDTILSFLVAAILTATPLAGQEEAASPASTPAAGEALAVIEAPTEPVPPGRLVTLDATGSFGSLFLWSANEPYPAPVENWSIDSGTKKVHFATPLQPGLYAWTLTVIENGDGDQTQVVVTVGDAPPPPPPAKLTIKLAKDTVSEDDGPGATSGTLTREAAGETDLAIGLLSSDPTVATVAPLAVIPAGDASVGFLINTIDNSTENADQVVTITAEAQGYVAVIATLMVLDDEGPPPPPPVALTLSVDPQSFKEGEEASAVVRRDGATTEALVVNLVSSDTAEATVPASVTIPARETTTTFEVEGVEDNTLDGDSEVTITATCAGDCTPGSADVTILDVDGAMVITELWGVLIYESEDRDDYGPGMAQVILGGRLDTVDERFTWLPFDKDEVDEDGNVPEDFAPWVDMLTSEGWTMPHLFFVQQEGKLVDHMTLPTDVTVDDIIADIRKHLPE
jgi:hypothetical protein